jgi:hypothetical protein
MRASHLQIALNIIYIMRNTIYLAQAASLGCFEQSPPLQQAFAPTASKVGYIFAEAPEESPRSLLYRLQGRRFVDSRSCPLISTPSSLLKASNELPAIVLIAAAVDAQCRRGSA